MTVVFLGHDSGGSEVEALGYWSEGYEVKSPLQLSGKRLQKWTNNKWVRCFCKMCCCCQFICVLCLLAWKHTQGLRHTVSPGISITWYLMLVLEHLSQAHEHGIGLRPETHIDASSVILYLLYGSKLMVFNRTQFAESSVFQLYTLHAVVCGIFSDSL